MTVYNDIPCVGNASACRPAKRNEFITIRVSSTIKAQLIGLAEQKDRSLSWMVNGVLEQFLSDNQSTDTRE